MTRSKNDFFCWMMHVFMLCYFLLCICPLSSLLPIRNSHALPSLRPFLSLFLPIYLHSLSSSLCFLKRFICSPHASPFLVFSLSPSPNSSLCQPHHYAHCHLGGSAGICWCQKEIFASTAIDCDNFKSERDVMPCEAR